MECTQNALKSTLQSVEKQVAELKGACQKTAGARLREHTQVLNRLDALENTPLNPSASPGPALPSRRELTALEETVADTVAQVTILVVEVEDLKGKLPAPSPSPAAPPPPPPDAEPLDGSGGHSVPPTPAPPSDLGAAAAAPTPSTEPALWPYIQLCSLP